MTQTIKGTCDLTNMNVHLGTVKWHISHEGCAEVLGHLVVRPWTHALVRREEIKGEGRVSNIRLEMDVAREGAEAGRGDNTGVLGLTGRGMSHPTLLTPGSEAT